MGTECEAENLDGGYRISCPDSQGFWALSKKLVSVEYTSSNKLVGTTWSILSETVILLAKNSRSDRDVSSQRRSEDTVPSCP